MTNLINEKLQSVCKLLSDRHLTIIGDVNDDLKCGICKNILIDAQLANCGCHFCKKCIEEYRNNGGIYCVGRNDECKHSDLSNTFANNNANRQISHLIAKCDEDNCDFACEIISMDSHLETCSRKKINCPFNFVGCKEMFCADKINDHVLMESYNHNLLLMEMMKILKNEINELRDNDRKNKCDITKILTETERNNNNINILKKENAEKELKYKVFEKKTENLRKEMNNFKDSFISKNKNISEDIIEMKTENKGDNLLKESTSQDINRKECDSLKNEVQILQMEMQNIEERMKIIISDEKKMQEDRLELINEDIKSIMLDNKELKIELTRQLESIVIDYKDWKKEMKKEKELISWSAKNIGLLETKIEVIKKELGKRENVKEAFEHGMKEIFSMVNEKLKSNDVESLNKEDMQFVKIKIENVETQMPELEDKEDDERIKRISQPLKSYDSKFAPFIWNIGMIKNVKKNEYIFSKCFSDVSNLYKMRLKLFRGIFDHWYVYLQFCKEDKDTQLKWPFKANVSIKVSDNLDSNKSINITGNCTINQPKNDAQYSESDGLKFHRSDLSKIGLLSTSDCIIEYFIDCEQ